MALTARTIGVALGLALAGAPAFAEYPERPVRIIVGYGAGGGTDLTARIIADQMSKDLGGTFIVENKPGGATTLAASLVAGAEPDGYTLMMTTVATLISSNAMEGLTYDYAEDLKGVALVASNDFALIVPKDSEIDTLADFVRLAREGELTYSSSGINSPSHLMTSEIADALDLNLINVPFTSSGEALTAVLGGEVDMNFSVTVNAAPMLADGQVKGIAVTSAARNELLPDLPPIADAGIPGYEALTWYGIVAPAGVPDELVEKLNAAVNAAVANPEVTAKLEEFGYTVRTGTAQEFQDYSTREIERWVEAVEIAAGG